MDSYLLRWVGCGRGRFGGIGVRVGFVELETLDG